MNYNPSSSAFLSRIPVSTTYPEENIRDAIFGFSIRYTAPGNRLVLSSQLGILFETITRSIESAITPDATIFSIFNVSYRLSAIQYVICASNHNTNGEPLCPVLRWRRHSALSVRTICQKLLYPSFLVNHDSGAQVIWCITNRYSMVRFFSYHG